MIVEIKWDYEKWTFSTNRFISRTVQGSAVSTMEGESYGALQIIIVYDYDYDYELELVRDLTNGAIYNDLV